jgi:prevent-host-death family protein
MTVEARSVDGRESCSHNGYMPRAHTVGARELKTRLGHYLRRVRAGETLVVTDRGEPTAELRPVVTSASPVDARLERLIALGVVSRRENRALAPFRAVRNAGRPVSDAIGEDRDERG